jgi:hypothetical protein
MEKNTLAAVKMDTWTFSHKKISDAGWGEFEIIASGGPNNKTYCIGIEKQWSMNCCGLHELYNVLKGHPWWSTATQKDITSLFDWLNTRKVNSNVWRAKEWILCLSKDQVSGEMKRFVKHPKVRLLDKFVNKSHEPNSICLYRYSMEKDFEYVEKFHSL